eukprot:6397676-Prymnesium_polylepis.1
MSRKASSLFALVRTASIEDKADVAELRSLPVQRGLVRTRAGSSSRLSACSSLRRPLTRLWLSSHAASASRWSPCSTIALPTTEPPVPSARCNDLASAGTSPEQCSTLVASLFHFVFST